MTTINGPILKEIAKIQSGIGLPPSTDGSGYGQCRAYTKNSEQCKRTLGKERKLLVANLLSEFRHVTDYGDIDNFYDKMAKFLDLTHCHSHGDGALEAFSKWKTERIASASSSSSTLATNAIFSSDSMEASSETSSVASPAPSSPVPGTLRRSPSVSDLHIEEAMRNLVLSSSSQNVATQRNNNELYRARILRRKLKSLGNVGLPSEGARQDPLEIYKTIKNPPPPGRMSDGIIYVYKHTSISGIFKIGYTNKSGLFRQRQSGNCYGIDTEIIYQTDKPFAGAYQAERIIHAVLDHKKLQVYNCSNCGRGHKEWFLTSRKEALEIVKCAESWLQMPAYTIHQGKVKLTPQAEVIYTSMFGFSLSGLSQHIHNNNAPEQISAIRRAESALQTMDSDTFNELTRPRSLQSTHLDSDEDYSDDEEPQEPDSGEDYSEVDSEELDTDEEDIEDDESEEFDNDEEDVEDEESQELGSDEESSGSEEPQDPYVEENHNQARGSQVRTRSQQTEVTPDVNIKVVEMLKAIRQGGAVEFRVIFPSQDL
ncbi:hypothetical protein TGAM01_v207354 [Trichoderma gamsii]|uniref:Bacteriophage T5 Orf172 DNA-binding domain-containing protein n=1 Tax=Trichoderma gamsii TaxID=398673 RepID=A0A2P4ZHF4_9HYPO|nr:hypothetical protein TGAM01_v207354 [Trichoderma gamsii]PON23707.1 hypothetical protein TGAM01_v207354 [Trichoderma gamsii]